MLPVPSIELRRFLGSLFLLAGAQFVDASTALVSARAIWDDETKEIVVVLDGHLDGTIVKEIDIGELVRGVNQTLRFRFDNRLGSDLTFTQVKVECSCTATRIPNELVPQGSQLVGEVDLAIDSTSWSCRFSPLFGPWAILQPLYDYLPHNFYEHSILRYQLVCRDSN